MFWSKFKSSRRIDAVEVTSDCLTRRSRLHLFARYLRGVKLYPHLERLFGSMRKHSEECTAPSFLDTSFSYATLAKVT